MNKVDRALYGPSLTEVILGATLSVAFGAVLGVALLVLKPVEVVKEIPKNAPADAVYYVAGPRGASNTATLQAKRKLLVAGNSVTVTQEELNALANAERPSMSVRPPKPAAPGAPAPAPAPSDTFTSGTPNLRIYNGELQVALPVKISLAGFDSDVTVQTRGTFAKHDTGFVYEPSKVLIGSCPVGRIPGMTGWVVGKFLLSKPFPADLVTAWEKLSNVEIIDSTLLLSMP